MARGRRRASGRTPALPVSQPLGPARRSTRAATRVRRQRRRRFRTSAGVTALSVVAVIAIGLLVRGAVRSPGASDATRPRTQRTLLVEVSGGDRAARVVSLLAYDPTSRASSMTMLPTRTLAEVPGIGTVPLANALRLGGPAAAKAGVADLLGVLIDDDWTLTADGFAALVSRVGGVLVDVDRDVIQPGRTRGTTVLVLRAGAAQRLDGPSAALYATYVGTGEDELAALPRFQAVLEAVLAALPAEPTALAVTLGKLGAGGKTSLRIDRLAQFLDGVRDAHVEGRFDPAILPVNPIDSGAKQVTYGIRPDEVAELVQRTLADSIPPGRLDGDRRVIVQNGVGTPGIGASVARRLTPAGYDIVDTRNAPRFGYQQSVVVIFDATDAARDRGDEVARLLGLRPEAVKIATITQSVADVIVIVGADYRR